MALEWRPDNKRDNRFKYISIAVVVFVLILGFIISSIDVPEEERIAKTKVPERVAQFILKKPKPKIVKPKPKLKPKPIFKPRLREKPKKLDKPLTKKQKKARKKAEDSGLLALADDLADLVDTSAINKMVGKRINKSTTTLKAATVNKDILTANTGKGSGGVNESKYATSSIGQTKLSASEQLALRQSMGKRFADGSGSGKSSKGNSQGGAIRGEEEVRYKLDQKIGQLNSLYQRARRTNPGKMGKLLRLHLL
jgi:outer membrane biosynthesis protein TonB